MSNLKQILRKKPTYNELVNYIEEDIPIRYPDRTATFLRNSHYLQQFDGDTFIDLEEQENNINKEKLKEMEVRKIAAETQPTAQIERVKQRIKGIKRTTMQLKQNQANRRASRAVYFDMTKDDNAPLFDISMDDAMADASYDLDVAAAEQADEIMQKQLKMKEKVNDHLYDLQPKDVPHQMASSSTEPMNVDREEKYRRVGRPLITTNTNLKESRDVTRSRSVPPSKRERKINLAGEGSNPMSVNDEETQQKRSKSVDTPSERKKRLQTSLLKEEGIVATTKAKAKAKASAVSSGNNESDDDVELTGITLNKSKSMKFWREQSANELRAQLKLRDPQKFKDEWAFKGKEQLIEIVQDLIKKKKW